MFDNQTKLLHNIDVIKIIFVYHGQHVSLTKLIILPPVIS